MPNVQKTNSKISRSTQPREKVQPATGQGNAGLRAEFVVGIGGSAGAFEAFHQLLEELPAKTGMAYVYVQHLDPSHESKLAELFRSMSTIPVVPIETGMCVAADRLYVLPPNRQVAIRNGAFFLTPRKNRASQSAFGCRDVRRAKRFTLWALRSSNF